MSVPTKFLKTLPTMVAAAGAGSVLAFLGRVALGIDWTAAEPMMRERLFVAGLDSVLVALLAGLLAVFVARGHSGRAFLLGFACGVGPWTWTLFALAVAVVGALWKFVPRLPTSLTWGGGVLAFALAPAVWLLPPNSDLMPHGERPPMVLPEGGLATPAPGRPDVVLIVGDTLRADAILDPSLPSPSIDRQTPTPNLDALRASGVWAKGAVAPANQTLPSHLSLLFALDIENVGMRSNRSRWPSRRVLVEQRGAQSLAERFAAAGYHTQAIVSNKLLSSAGPGGMDDKQWMGQGFHSWYDISRQPSTLDYLKWVEYHSLIGVLASHQVVFKKRPLNFFLRRMLIPPSLNGYRLHFEEGEVTVAEVKRSLAELTASERPYFLFANFMEPHDPYLPPPDFVGTIAKEEDRPSNFSADVEGEFQMRRQLHIGCLNKDDVTTPEIYLPTGRHLHNLYKEEVAYLDQLLGQTLDAIRATGRPTIILFVSDHGEGFGEHADPAHGHTLFESEIYVPFILSGAGVPQRGELPFTPELVDGSRTLLELAGVDTKWANGRNVLDASFTQRATLSFRNGQVSTFDGRWKLHADFEYDNDTAEAMLNGEEVVAGAYQLQPIYLFDLLADPGETNNLLEQQPQEAARLVAAIEERLKQDIYPELQVRQISSEEGAELDALGYGENSRKPTPPPSPNSNEAH